MATIDLGYLTSATAACPVKQDGGKAITKSDTDIFSAPVAVYVGGAGVVTCTPANGGADVAVTVPAGGMVPFRVLAVKSTGTTATLMVAVY
ncbi:spike base protein, RCAP_Rcc01079 family [Stutzerimonas kunmingensis]|uniref:spike base protein, RCAP_Rcc01079 family n=1 Tax=Stutzerimonas kunmingensis TaxID=1211807 RepID=UPI002FC9E8F5